jgi:dephospho-CoA kinase
MVIELFGLPGGGKSTVAKELSALLGIPVIRLTLLKRILFWMRALLSSPVQTTSGVRFLFHHGDKNRYSLFMNGCLDRYARFSKARATRGIIDEGPLQNILSFPGRTLFQKEVDSLVASFPHPDVLIHVSADPETRKDRQKTRGRVVRDDAWEVYARENERMALLALPPKVTVFEFPTMSAQEIAEKIKCL